MIDRSKKIFITGSCGFIGYHLAKKLLEQGYTVIGIDNMNSYYDIKLKEDRLAILQDYSEFTFIEGSIADKAAVTEIFESYRPEYVVNLAAQPGVRYSIDHPDTYIESNIIGFYNILEACRNYSVEHLVYASSSSVYGNRKEAPFHETDFVDHPISLYAATKKSDELMAYTYTHLYKFPSTGLRFFTVYGDFGRPDMAYFKFANKIMNNEPIEIYNHGNMLRDFTYVDDIVDGIINIIPVIPPENEDGDRYKIYNIGNSSPVKLMHMIEVLEQELGKEAEKVYLGMQAGDVTQTYADVTELERDFNFKPSITIEDGLHRFAKWYKEYYGY